MTTEYTPTTTEVDEYFAIRTAEVFEAGASWLAEYLLSDENVERAARGAYDGAFLNHAPEDVDRWGDLVADNHPAVESWRNVARTALQAVLGKEQP